MLPDTLAASIREVGEANGGALLLDAGSGRAILTEAQHAFDLCKNLRRAGFTRFVDFTATHNGDENFTLYLSLRAPEHTHARLTLKWKWTQAATHAPCEQRDPPAAVARQAVQPRTEDSTDQPSGGDERSGAGLQTRESGRSEDLAHLRIHPSLSTIWPAAAVAEREIFEMLGIAFAGNALEPLLLDEAFVDHPLRREFVVPEQESYVDKLLQQRHAVGLIEALEARTTGAAGSLPAYGPEGNSATATQSVSEVEHSLSGQAVRYPDDSEANHD